MVYGRRILLVFLIMSLSGCSYFGRAVKKEKLYEEGYRQGVKENISDFSQAFYGNDFPYFYWSSPIVQHVRIPAHIENGLFIPEHNEPVVIEPAEWRKRFAYPIKGLKNEEEAGQIEGGKSYEVEHFDFNVRDITVLPGSYAGAGSGCKEKDSH